MPVFGLVLLAQIICAIHVVRTGRPYFWIFLIVFVPLLGMAVYVLTQILPAVLGSPRARRAAGEVSRALNPGRALREAERRLAMTATAENRATLAEAYLGVGRTQEALDLFREALTGIHASDAAMMLGLARTHFARGEFVEAQGVLEQLQQTNAGYTSPELRLLYASCLEAQGKIEEALLEYKSLAPIYPGQEARYRYAVLLRQAGRDADARQIFQDICQAEGFTPRHARRRQGEWFALARRQLAE